MAVNDRTHAREYRVRLNLACGGNLVLWKTIKGLLFSAMFGAVGWYAVRHGAPPAQMATVVVAAIMASFLVELQELQIAGLVTLTFDQDDGSDDENNPETDGGVVEGGEA